MLKIFDYIRDDQDYDPTFIRLTRNILIVVTIATATFLILLTALSEDATRYIPALITLTIMLVLEGVSLYYVLQDRVRMAKVIVPTALLVGATVIALNTNGLRSVAVTSMPVILIISAILLGRRAFFITTPVAVISAIVIAIADLSGRVEYVPAGLDIAFIVTVLFIASAGIIHILVSRLSETIEQAQTNENLQREKNVELDSLRSTLEERVAQRAAELEAASRSIEKRARQFEAITQVLRAVSTLQNLDTLLPRITEVISEQFNFYHAGIFLLDNDREFAVLRAANSPGGRNMLLRGHKLKVGQTGIVGFVTATGQPRIALDVGVDAVFFNNPDLPKTRSEMALPLRYGGQIIGALDVQSTEPNAFEKDDLEALTALADQVAIAISNARTLEEARRSLEEAQSAIGTSTREVWQSIRPKSLGLGLQLKESSVTPLEKPMDDEHVRQAVERGEVVISKPENGPARIAIPIRLRGQVIGVMNLQTRRAEALIKDQVDIAAAIAERLSLALETATLIQAAQHRASIEHVTATISSRIGLSTRFETILQTAAQELSRALGGSDVLVQIEPVSLEMSSNL
jgi:GAF domain-containing protein